MKISKNKIKVDLVMILLKLITISELTAQINSALFVIKPISKEEYQNGYKNNYNAEISEINDTSLIEKAFEAISKTYNEDEIEFANREIITTREITSFESYYPLLNIYLFYIQDYHYEKACFVSALTNQVLSSHRYRGSFGVMSKDGRWIGLERGDCDNYLQLEICEITNEYATSIYKFDYKNLDIYFDYKSKIPPMFWAKKNTVYISTRAHGKDDKSNIEYYALHIKPTKQLDD
jgi:uncharacterized protein YifN (PemK superfamily)